MEYNLIEIAKDKTNFFTSIFVYDNKGVLPTHFVEEPVLLGNGYEFKEISCFIVKFKDIESGELIDFFVDRDGDIIDGEKSKICNHYLLQEMQDFVRLNCDNFDKYYLKKITIDELIEKIKLPKKLFEKSHKLVWLKYNLTDEMYWNNRMKLNSVCSNQLPQKAKDLHSFLYPQIKIFKENVSKCVLWYDCKEQLKVWKTSVVNILKDLKTIVKNKIYTCSEKAIFYKFFNKNIDDWDILCAMSSTMCTMQTYFSLDYKNFGRPNLVAGVNLLRVYKHFQKEYYDWIMSNDDSKLEQIIDKYLKLAIEQGVVDKQNKITKKENGLISYDFIYVDGQKVDLNCTYLNVLPDEEIDKQIKMLRYETTSDSLFITAEKLFNDYYRAVQLNSKCDYEKLFNELTDYNELIIYNAQFLKGNLDVFDFLKHIIAKREDLGKPTAIYSNDELKFQLYRGNM